MTTVISRLYPDRATAESVAHAMLDAGIARSALDVIDSGGADALAAARVGKANAAGYAAHLSGGRAVLVARVPFNPVGAARRAQEIADATPSLHIGLDRQNEYVREKASGAAFLSILPDHPRFFSHDMGALDSRARGLVSHAFGFRTLSKSRDKTSAAGRSRTFFPGSNVRAGKVKTSAIRGGWKFSDMIGWRTVARS
jgi:hypothetical protein